MNEQNKEIPHELHDIRGFLILWGSQAVSTLGTAMTSFALAVWVYEQKGTATSITLLSAFSFLPSVLFCFVAGTIADRWNKKRIMLLADLFAALGTAVVLLLYSSARLQIWHLYVINFLLSFMNAFQNPASYLATSLLVPRKHYVRASGLQAFSRSLVTIAAPAFASALLAFGGLKAVLLLDLGAFAVAFFLLLFFIRIPEIKHSAQETKERFLKSCMKGINFLREHRALLSIILFFAFVNFIAKMGGYGMMPAMVLSRTGGDRAALGIVEAAVGAGTLVGGLMVTLMKPARSRVKVIFISCGLSFLLGDVGQSLTHSALPWVAAAFASSLPLAFLNANLTAVMRSNVPIEMQGRVFSARDTIQFSAIPLGLFSGGLLADHVFEPLMLGSSPLQSALSAIFGTGKGAGIALMFFIVGIVGFAASLACLKNPLYRELDEV